MAKVKSKRRQSAKRRRSTEHRRSTTNSCTVCQVRDDIRSDKVPIDWSLITLFMLGAKQLNLRLCDGHFKLAERAHLEVEKAKKQTPLVHFGNA